MVDNDNDVDDDMTRYWHLSRFQFLDILGESNPHPPSSIVERWHLGAQLIVFVSMLTSIGIGILVFGKFIMFNCLDTHKKHATVAITKDGNGRDSLQLMTMKPRGAVTVFIYK